MINIIKSDIYRIFRGKAIYIAIVIMMVMIVISCYELSPGYIGMTSISDQQTESTEKLTKEDMGIIIESRSLKKMREIMKKYPYELDKEIIGANANLYYIFIIIIVVVLSSDFSNSCIKNSISSAISRKKYYLSKLSLSFVLCTGLIILNNYGAYFLNLIMNNKAFSSSLGEIAKCTLYQLPILYGIMSVLVGLCFIVKKTSVFNTISIPLLLVSQLALSGIIKLFSLKPNIVNYEFQVALGNLINNPTNEYLIRCTILGIIYILLFNLIGYYSFKKAEIK